MDDEDRERVSRRLRAMIALAGFSGVKAFGAELERQNAGVKTWRLHEMVQKRGDAPRIVDLRVIAEACGLPYEFFTFDFATLGAEQNGQADFERRLREVEQVSAMVKRDLAPLAGLDAAQLEKLVAAAARTQPASRTQTTTRKRTAS